MEDILKKCCQADNDSIQQGTKELREALKKPEAIAALCNVVVSSQDLEIRQYAAIVLGKRMQRFKNWMKLLPEDRAYIKAGILQAVDREPEKPVRNCIVFFIGAIMKHENANGGWRTAWPELYQYLLMSSSSDDKSRREMGLHLLSLFVDLNAKLFAEDADTICKIVISTIKMYPVDSGTDPKLPPCVMDAIDVLKSLALGTQNVQSIINTAYEVLPFILKMIYQCALANQSDAVKYLRLLDALSESVPSVFDPQLKNVVTMCMDLAKEPKIDEEVRMKALALLGLLATKKKKALIKHDLVQPILETLFTIVATPPAEPEDPEDDDDDDSPSSYANQALDSFALNLPPNKVVAPMLKYIDQGIQSPEQYLRKAACLSMAVMAEGCAEYIRSKHLTTFIQYVLKGIQDESPIVRNAALFALGQFSEYLQPDVSQYSEQVMPILLTYLDNLCQKMVQDKDVPDSSLALITRLFYALEMFCENLNERLVPYLDEVVKRLLNIFSGQSSVKVRELAISALNSAATAAKERMVDYVPHILSVLHTFLTKPQTEECLSLQIHAVDTLAVLARCLGKENFRPLADESLQIALNLLVSVDDPDLRRVTYGLIGALGAVMGEDMQKCMESVVNFMLGTLKSEEGNQILDVEDRDGNEFQVYDDVSDDNDEEDIGDESDRSEDFDGPIHVEDAFSEEKEEACSALAELAKSTGRAFLPYYDECFTQLVKLANHPGGSVKGAALDALAELTAALGEFAPEKKEDQLKAVAFIVPKCVEVIQTDIDRDVVATAMDALDKLLLKLKGEVFQTEGHKEAIVNSVMQVLTGKTQCQECGDGDEDEEEDSEQDEILYEYAGNLLPSLGRAMPLEDFLELFQKVFPLLMTKAQDHRSDAQKSFVVGTFAETMSILGDYTTAYFNDFFPLFMKLSTDENDEVRSNSFFGLGELVLHGKKAAFGSYPAILARLSEAVSKETAATNLDNICGALARMIVTNASLVPIESVLPVFLEKLPLREDFEENLSVFLCFNHLYQLGNPTMRQLIPGIIRVAIGVIYRKEHTSRETLQNVVHFLTSVQRDFPEDFQAATSDVLPEQLQVLQERLAEAEIH